MLVPIAAAHMHTASHARVCPFHICIQTFAPATLSHTHACSYHKYVYIYITHMHTCTYISHTCSCCTHTYTEYMCVSNFGRVLISSALCFRHAGCQRDPFTPIFLMLRYSHCPSSCGHHGDKEENTSWENRSIEIVPQTFDGSQFCVSQL